MVRIKRFLVVAVFLSTISTVVHAQESVNVKCPSGATDVYKSITAALNAFPPSQGPLTIAASGTCKENVDLTRLSGVTISGNPTVTIEPATASQPTIVTAGTTSLNSVKIVAGASSSAINAEAGSILTINNSSITGPGNGIVAYAGGTVALYNTNVIVTGSVGVQVVGGVLLLDANTHGSSKITSAQTGVFCQMTNLYLVADVTSTLSITDNPANGVFALNCAIDTNGALSPIQITNNASSGEQWGILIEGGFATLQNVDISGNRGFGGVGILHGANVRFGGTTIANNKQAGIAAKVGGIADYTFYTGTGVTTVTGNGTNFSCYQGGKQYADNASTISPPPASSSCLQIGGP